MLGKIPKYLLRLSLIIQSLHDSFNYVMTMDSSRRHKLDSNTDEEITAYVSDSIDKPNEITEESIIRAYKLLSYFNKHKLILAGYSFDLASDIEEIFNNLIKENNVSSFNHSPETKIVSYILQSNQSEFNLADLNHRFSRYSNIAVVKKIVKNLADNNFGRIIERKNQNGPTTKYFIKYKIEMTNLDTIDFLQNNGVDIDIFVTVNNTLITGKFKI